MNAIPRDRVITYQWRRPEFSKIHISKTKVQHLRRRRDTCLMDFGERVFYHGPIAI